MDLETLLAPVTGFLPAAWSEDARGLAVLLGGGVLIIVLMMVGARLFGGGARVREEAVPAAPAAAGARDAAPAPKLVLPLAAPALRGPDLDPEEWVPGDIIHLDRQKAVGLIRCDRVKSPVQFRLAPGRAHVRVGEKVRFKGRHGARRRPVADVVERAG